MSILSNYIRGFNSKRWWKYYKRAQNSSGLVREFYTALYMRLATLSGGYVGRSTTFLGMPILPHGFHGIHISKDAELGVDCIVYQNVTIGNYEGAPCIGNGVLIGANAVILGGVTIGDNAKIGAGAIVVENVPEGATVVGSKARLIIE